jgi:dinuclear metal center YbgI/SA1388 family protein
MPTVADVSRFLESYAPPRLAEDWDNIGLLVGDDRAQVTKIMTCLTITPASAAEAIREQAELIVTHHPLPFRPLKRITCQSPEGRMLWELIGARIAIFSPHTAFDSAAEGINQRLADGLALTQIAPLRLADPAGISSTSAAGATLASGPLGAGRQGGLPTPITLAELASQLKRLLKIESVQIVGDGSAPLRRVAVACGSAGEFLADAAEQGCDCLVTGETRFHTCLEAEALGIALVLVGHYASERFGVEGLADVLGRHFPDVAVWASRDERDPLRWM